MQALALTLAPHVPVKTFLKKKLAEPTNPSNGVCVFCDSEHTCQCFPTCSSPLICKVALGLIHQKLQASYTSSLRPQLQDRALRPCDHLRLKDPIKCFTCDEFWVKDPIKKTLGKTHLTLSKLCLSTSHPLHMRQTSHQLCEHIELGLPQESFVFFSLEHTPQKIKSLQGHEGRLFFFRKTVET